MFSCATEGCEDFMFVCKKKSFERDLEEQSVMEIGCREHNIIKDGFV